MPDVVNELMGLIDPITLVACLIAGYIIKHWLPADNNIIPTVVCLLGMLVAVIIALSNGVSISAELIVGGAVSGLASTGLHQVFKTWLESLGGG